MRLQYRQLASRRGGGSGCTVHVLVPLVAAIMRLLAVRRRSRHLRQRLHQQDVLEEEEDGEGNDGKAPRTGADGVRLHCVRLNDHVFNVAGGQRAETGSIRARLVLMAAPPFALGALRPAWRAAELRMGSHPHQQWRCGMLWSIFASNICRKCSTSLDLGRTDMHRNRTHTRAAAVPPASAASSTPHPPPPTNADRSLPRAPQEDS